MVACVARRVIDFRRNRPNQTLNSKSSTSVRRIETLKPLFQRLLKSCAHDFWLCNHTFNTSSRQVDLHIAESVSCSCACAFTWGIIMTSGEDMAKPCAAVSAGEAVSLTVAKSSLENERSSSEGMFLTSLTG